MICPYYKSHANVYIKCVRGAKKLEHKGDLKIHVDKYCNGKYRSCSTYLKLERAW